MIEAYQWVAQRETVVAGTMKQTVRDWWPG